MHVITPLIRLYDPAPEVGQALLKMECWQPTGSFKIRGIGELCRRAVADGKTRLVSSSGGNAGLAAAHAGANLGAVVDVIVPETTPDAVRNRLVFEGARVRIHGSGWDEADQLARQIVADDPTAAYVSPFDDPAIWYGHSTMISECVDQGPKPDAVIVSVGGGGLMCGVLEGLHAVGWADVPLVAVETRGADSLAASINADQLVTLPAITSIASSLGARTVARAAFDWTRRHTVTSVVVSDEQAVQSAKRFLGFHRVAVEPACGAALAVIYDRLIDADNPLVIVCGGVNTSAVMPLQASPDPS